MKKKIAIIGSGYSGLSTAAILAKNGYEVTIFEKNKTCGGRSRSFKEKGYTFDMGPSWYWMCDVFDNFFKQLNKKRSDYYKITRLNPGFKIIFENHQDMIVPAEWNSICELFEKTQKGSSIRLNKFMKEASQKYNISMKNLIYNPGLSLKEFLKIKIIKNLFKLNLFSSYRKHITKYFKHPKLIALLEFPILFLGSTAQNTPALYSLITYSGIKEGTFYPSGGFGKVIDAFVKLCQEFGVKINTNEEIIKLEVEDKKIKKVITTQGSYNFDIVVSSADYHHTESKLIEKKYRNYKESFWNSKTFSPSCLLFYLGINKKIKKLEHHNLFFDEDIESHIQDIYTNKKWPKKPLFYTCCPSKTDSSVAPKGKENIFILIPITPGLKDDEKIREQYFSNVIKRLESYTKSSIIPFIEYKRSYCIKDFINDYHAYKGNAYGLANTLMQTANLKPKIINKKIKNLYYTGQLTVPGPGVPPAIISGQIVAEQIMNKSLK